MEFHVAALSDVWRPDQIMNKAQCPSLFSITSAEARGRILCNYATLQQWLHEAYGEAAATFRRAVEVAPGDPLVIGNFFTFLGLGLLNFLSASEKRKAEELKERLLSTKGRRQEREGRLLRLERARKARLTFKQMESERQVRQGARDRLVEAARRDEMMKHDLRLMAFLRSRAVARKEMIGNVGKSQQEIAEERKRVREEAARKKKEEAAKKRKAKKKAEKEKKKKKKKNGEI